jgi:hypothetical protein
MLKSKRTLLAAGVGAIVLGLAGTARAAAIDFKVPGTVPAIQQPSGMTCWATTATIMRSWKTNSSMTIETAMAAAGAGYLAQFKANEGMSGAAKPAFLQAMALKAEGPQNFSIAGWEKLLRTHGPLWVTTNEGSGKNFAIHARVITGIDGDGTAEKTFFTIVDPGLGAVVRESVATFIQKFESVARADQATDLRPQVVHY